VSDSTFAALSSLLTFAGGFTTALVAEPLRQRLWRTKVSLAFGRSEDFVSPTPERSQSLERQAFFLRIRAVNESSRLAKACRAYLTSIEREVAPGRFNRTIYVDSIQLAWAVRPQGRFDPVDLPPGIPHFIDVLSTHEGVDLFQPELATFPHRYMDLVATPARYRLTVRLSGDGVRPATLRLIFKWAGTWNDFEASPEAEQ
jgi:hypothetical protein